MIHAYYSVLHLPVLCCKENCSSVWNSSWVALTCTVLQSANLWGMEVCINTHENFSLKTAEQFDLICWYVLSSFRMFSCLLLILFFNCNVSEQQSSWLQELHWWFLQMKMLQGLHTPKWNFPTAKWSLDQYDLALMERRDWLWKRFYPRWLVK